MKRFFLFAWNSDERAGGWANFVDSFETAEAAMRHYETTEDGRFKLSHDLYEIVDTHTGPKGTVVNI